MKYVIVEFEKTWYYGHNSSGVLYTVVWCGNLTIKYICNNRYYFFRKKERDLKLKEKAAKIYT